MSLPPNGNDDELGEFGSRLAYALDKAQFKIKDFSRVGMVGTLSVCPHPKGILIEAGPSVLAAASAIADSLKESGIFETKPTVCQVNYPAWDQRARHYDFSSLNWWAFNWLYWLSQVRKGLLIPAHFAIS